jgi:hypothetical protein
MEELSPTLWVCAASKLLQFKDETGSIETRYPHPVRLFDQDQNLMLNNRPNGDQKRW